MGMASLNGEPLHVFQTDFLLQKLCPNGCIDMLSPYNHKDAYSLKKMSQRLYWNGFSQVKFII